MTKANTQAQANANANVKKEEAKAPQFLTIEYLPDGKSITFKVVDVPQKFEQTLSFSIDQVNDDIKAKAMLHGFNQKIRDAAAGNSGNSKKGIASDGRQAIANMQAVIEALTSGEWNRKGGGDNKAVVINKLTRAIARHMKVEEAKALETILKAEEEVWRKWWNSPKIQEVWAQIDLEDKQEKAKSATDDGLGDLTKMFS